MFKIFDLDGTVIDSSHRSLCLDSGEIDLPHWRENSTPEKIAQDTLLPLADYWKAAYRKGFQIIVCTNRVMAGADYDYLHENGLLFHTMLARPGECSISGPDLKELRLRLYVSEHTELTWKRFCIQSEMFEDCPAIMHRMAIIGISVIDAKLWNGRMLDRRAYQNVL